MTSSAPSLSNAAVNLSSIREHARKELVSILTSFKGDKNALVLDPEISGPLNLIAEVDLLKKSGIDTQGGIFYLDGSRPLVTAAPHIIYLVRPNIEHMAVIAKQIHDHRRTPATANKKYGIYCVPRLTMSCERELEREGVLGDVTTGSFQMDIIPFDENVLSLEAPNSFRECFLDGDPSSLYFAAKSIMKLQSIFGFIPSIKGKGDNAYRVWKLLERMRRETATGTSTSSSSIVPEIASLILLDRSVDLATPMLTQLTYEGMIDEIFGINNGFVDIDAELVGGKGNTTGKRKLALNNSDLLFQEIRDLNFRVLGPLLHQKSKLVKETYDKRHQATGSVSELHSYMGEFKTAHAEHNFLQTHINIAERVNSQTLKNKTFDRKVDMEWETLSGDNHALVEDYIIELISKQEPLVMVLRMLCLYSVTLGVRAKRYEIIYRELISTYGFETMFTLNNLEKLGIFSLNKKKSSWPAVRKALRLITPREQVKVETPDDINYVFGGYAPLSVRLIELAHAPGWKRFDEVISTLPGRTFEVTQESASNRSEEEEQGTTSTESIKKPLCLVFFLGGVSFSEISALRHLSERPNHPWDYLVATTKLINGKSLLSTIIEKVENNLNQDTVKP